MSAARRHIAFLEAELAKRDKTVDLLLDRLMARNYAQFTATHEDDYLAAYEPDKRNVLYDDTGLLEVDIEDEPED